MACGLENAELKELVLPMIEGAKWYLWHGNVVRALEKTEIPTTKELKLQKAVKEFQAILRTVFDKQSKTSI